MIRILRQTFYLQLFWWIMRRLGSCRQPSAVAYGVCVCITTLSEERMYAVAKKRQFHGNDRWNRCKTFWEACWPGPRTCSPHPQVDDCARQLWDPLARFGSRKSDCWLFCLDILHNMRLSLWHKTGRKANLALNNGSTRFEPKQGGSSDVAPVDSSALWYKTRGYQHHLATVMIDGDDDWCCPSWCFCPQAQSQGLWASFGQQCSDIGRGNHGYFANAIVHWCGLKHEPLFRTKHGWTSSLFRSARTSWITFVSPSARPWAQKIWISCIAL